MIVPEVSLASWRSLYERAATFQDLAPWDFFNDDELLAVQDPKSGEIGYSCILGARGEVFGLCLYRGSKGLVFYEQIQAGEIDGQTEDVFAMQDCLLAEFTARSQLEREDLAVIKALGINLRRQDPHPSFRSHRPGYTPWFLCEDEVHFLAAALDCLCQVAKEYEDRPPKRGRDKAGRYPLYTLDATVVKGWRRRWFKPDPLPAPDLPSAPLDEVGLRRLKAAKLQSDSAWEADFFYLPGCVIEGEGRPYWGRMLMVAHATSGVLFHGKIVGPETEPCLALRNDLVAIMVRQGICPAAIHVRNPILAEVLRPLGAVAGFEVAPKAALPRIAEAKEYMVNRAMAGSAAPRGKRVR